MSEMSFFSKLCQTILEVIIGHHKFQRSKLPMATEGNYCVSPSEGMKSKQGITYMPTICSWHFGDDDVSDAVSSATFYMHATIYVFWKSKHRRMISVLSGTIMVEQIYGAACLACRMTLLPASSWELVSSFTSATASVTMKHWSLSATYSFSLCLVSSTG